MPSKLCKPQGSAVNSSTQCFAIAFFMTFYVPMACALPLCWKFYYANATLFVLDTNVTLTNDAVPNMGVYRKVINSMATILYILFKNIIVMLSETTDHVIIPLGHQLNYW